MPPATVLRLDRANLSETAADAVREMIVDGRLAPGERVNEVRLAAALGVSRTPLREGLRLLAAEGALEAAAHYGFFVRALTVEELEQLYDIRRILDPEALRIAGLPDAVVVARLEKLNHALSKARGPAAVDLDDEWHFALLAHCPNRVLIDLIVAMARRTRRYEIALMREVKNVAQTREAHSRILEALAGGDLAGACAALEENMKSGKKPIIEWLKERA
jgi:DNA-binding GntR family transcriptional regulator